MNTPLLILLLVASFCYNACQSCVLKSATSLSVNVPLLSSFNVGGNTYYAQTDGVYVDRPKDGNWEKVVSVPTSKINTVAHQSVTDSYFAALQNGTFVFGLPGQYFTHDQPWYTNVNTLSIYPYNAGYLVLQQDNDKGHYSIVSVELEEGTLLLGYVNLPSSIQFLIKSYQSAAYTGTGILLAAVQDDKGNQYIIQSGDGVKWTGYDAWNGAYTSHKLSSISCTTAYDLPNNCIFGTSQNDLFTTKGDLSVISKYTGAFSYNGDFTLDLSTTQSAYVAYGADSDSNPLLIVSLDGQKFVQATFQSVTTGPVTSVVYTADNGLIALQQTAVGHYTVFYGSCQSF